MKVSHHAIKRFRQRTGCKQSDEYVRYRVLDLLGRAVEIELKNKKFRTLALLNHDMREAQYFRAGEFVFVVDDGVVTTVHNGEANRWKEKET
jgi:hypothetical protein